jgi:hypothetical protein
MAQSVYSPRDTGLPMPGVPPPLPSQPGAHHLLPSQDHDGRLHSDSTQVLMVKMAYPCKAACSWCFLAVLHMTGVPPSFHVGKPL